MTYIKKINIEEIIGKSYFLKGFSASNCSKIAQKGKILSIKRKNNIFIEGDSGNYFYLCLNGKIQISKSTADGKEIVINIISSGEFFAEIILFENTKYPVTAKTLTDSEILVINKNDFDELLDEREFRNDFLRMLFNKQKYLAERIKNLMIFEVEDRFFKFIFEHYGKTEKIKLDLSKKEIAAAIGSTPETFSRLLQRLTSENKIEIKGKNLRFLSNFGIK